MEVFPTIDLFPRITRAGQFIKRLVHFLPETPLATHGDHLPHDVVEEQLQFPIIDDRPPRLERVE